MNECPDVSDFLLATACKLGFEIRNASEPGGSKFVVIDTFVNAPVFLGSVTGTEAEKRQAVMAFMQKVGAPKVPPPDRR